MVTRAGRASSRRPFGVVSAGAAALALISLSGQVGRSDARRTAIVRSAPFVETLTERGTVNAARLMLYGSTIAGTQAKILDLAPEGSPVAAGDVLIRFDSTPFELAVQRETAAVAQAEAEQLRAREDLHLEQMRAEADTSAAREQLASAQSALASEREGRGPLAVAEAEAAARDAARELDRATATVDDMRALLKEGFVTRAEADRAEQALEQARDRKQLAELKLRTLRQFEQPAAIGKSAAELTAAQKGVVSAGDAAESRLIQRRAALALADSRANDARLRLAGVRDQVARTIVRAETSGLVVYRELFFGTEKRKPQPGDEVWPNQPIIAVPDPGQLVVETRVREIDLQKVSRNQAVHVSLDAYPDVSLPAQVAMIGALAQEDAARAGAKYFPVTVKLLRTDTRLRTGMTARVGIDVTSLPMALIVPVESVVDESGAATCYVVSASGAQARPVTVLGRNALSAAITGLRAGDRVLLDPTVEASSRRP